VEKIADVLARTSLLRQEGFAGQAYFVIVFPILIQSPSSFRNRISALTRPQAENRSCAS